MSIVYAHDNAQEIDKEKSERLKQRILKMEEKNNKTKTLNDQEMVRRIVKMIEEEVDCY